MRSLEGVYHVDLLGTWQLAVVAVLRGDRALLLQMHRSPIRHPSKDIALRVVCSFDAFGLSRYYLASVFSLQALNYRFGECTRCKAGRCLLLCVLLVAFLAQQQQQQQYLRHRVMFRVFGFRCCSSSSQPTLPSTMLGCRCRHPARCVILSTTYVFLGT